MIEPQEFADMHRGQLVAVILELRGCHEFTAGRLAEVEARAEQAERERAIDLQKWESDRRSIEYLGEKLAEVGRERDSARELSSERHRALSSVAKALGLEACTNADIEARAERLAASLRWYADGDNWAECDGVRPGARIDPPAHFDGGDRARAALADAPEPKPCAGCELLAAALRGRGEALTEAWEMLQDAGVMCEPDGSTGNPVLDSLANHLDEWTMRCAGDSSEPRNLKLPNDAALADAPTSGREEAPGPTPPSPCDRCDLVDDCSHDEGSCEGFRAQPGRLPDAPTPGREEADGG
jgi:hypothetical protein